MSALSEALERQLRKVMPLPKAAAVSPKKAAILQAKSISLAYQEGTSDKVYHVQITGVGGGPYGLFEVHFQYGRRGKTLIKGTKTSTPVSWGEASRIYIDLVHEKRTKGYKEI